PFFMRLAGASEVEIGDGFDVDGAVRLVTGGAVILIPMSELVDFAAEAARLSKELKDAEKQLENINSKLSNEGFLAKAPENVVTGQKEAAARLEEKISMLRANIDKINLI
ncbi:MAG: valine--tRNA ligase, partial [Oscillospiraceae bacterium]|nr:valine--tRNA ligase [Oscillospiraceae bacterium]